MLLPLWPRQPPGHTGAAERDAAAVQPVRDAEMDIVQRERAQELGAEDIGKRGPGHPLDEFPEDEAVRQVVVGRNLTGPVAEPRLLMTGLRVPGPARA